MRELSQSELEQVAGGDAMENSINWAGGIAGVGAAVVLGGGAGAAIGAFAVGYGVIALAGWGYSLATGGGAGARMLHRTS